MDDRLPQLMTSQDRCQRPQDLPAGLHLCHPDYHEPGLHQHHCGRRAHILVQEKIQDFEYVTGHACFLLLHWLDVVTLTLPEPLLRSDPEAVVFSLRHDDVNPQSQSVPDREPETIRKWVISPCLQSKTYSVFTRRCTEMPQSLVRKTKAVPYIPILNLRHRTLRRRRTSSRPLGNVTMVNPITISDCHSTD